MPPQKPQCCQRHSKSKKSNRSTVNKISKNRTKKTIVTTIPMSSNEQTSFSNEQSPSDSTKVDNDVIICDITSISTLEQCGWEHGKAKASIRFAYSKTMESNKKHKSGFSRTENMAAMSNETNEELSSKSPAAMIKNSNSENGSHHHTDISTTLVVEILEGHDKSDHRSSKTNHISGSTNKQAAGSKSTHHHFKCKSGTKGNSKEIKAQCETVEESSTIVEICTPSTPNIWVRQEDMSSHGKGHPMRDHNAALDDTIIPVKKAAVYSFTSINALEQNNWGHTPNDLRRKYENVYLIADSFGRDVLFSGPAESGPTR